MKEEVYNIEDGTLEKIYPEERFNLSQLEKNKSMYHEKMSHFLSKNDIWQLDYL